MTEDQIARAEAIRLTRNFARGYNDSNLYLNCWLMTGSEIQRWHLEHLYKIPEPAMYAEQEQEISTDPGEDSFADPDA